MFMHVIYSWDSVYSRFGHSFVVKKKKKIQVLPLAIILIKFNSYQYILVCKKKKKKFNIYFKIRIFKAVTD